MTIVVWQDTGFFRGWGGAWDTPYGCFFMKWYSDNLLLHGERLCKIASCIFNTSRPQRCTPRYKACHESSPLNAMSVLSDLSSILRHQLPEHSQPQSQSHTPSQRHSPFAKKPSSQPADTSFEPSDLADNAKTPTSPSVATASQQSGSRLKSGLLTGQASPSIPIADAPRTPPHNDFKDAVDKPTSRSLTLASDHAQRDTSSTHHQMQHMPCGRQQPQHAAALCHANACSSSDNHMQRQAENTTQREPGISSTADSGCPPGLMGSDTQTDRHLPGLHSRDQKHANGQVEAKQLRPCGTNQHASVGEQHSRCVLLSTSSWLHWTILQGCLGTR